MIWFAFNFIMTLAWVGIAIGVAAAALMAEPLGFWMTCMVMFALGAAARRHSRRL